MELAVVLSGEIKCVKKLLTYPGKCSRNESMSKTGLLLYPKNHTIVKIKPNRKSICLGISGICHIFIPNERVFDFRNIGSGFDTLLYHFHEDINMATRFNQILEKSGQVVSKINCILSLKGLHNK